MSEELKNSPIEDFDWEAFEKGETQREKSQEELEKTYDKSLGSFKDHEVTEGTVISINKREVVVNIGAKSDGIIPFNEFRYNPDLKVGDTVEVYVESQEDRKGQLVAGKDADILLLNPDTSLKAVYSMGCLVE